MPDRTFDNRFRDTMGSEESSFFVNKREAKKLRPSGPVHVKTARAPTQESFLLLFFKKEALPSPYRLARSIGDW